MRSPAARRLSNFSLPCVSPRSRKCDLPGHAAAFIGHLPLKAGTPSNMHAKEGSASACGRGDQTRHIADSSADVVLGSLLPLSALVPKGSLEKRSPLAGHDRSPRVRFERQQVRRSDLRAEKGLPVDNWRQPPLCPPTSTTSFGPGTWLNDAEISAVYASMAADTGGQPLSESLLLMDPALAFWLSAPNTDASAQEEACSNLLLQRRTLVLCPVNDGCATAKGDTGTHWSLLVCVAQPAVSGFVFFHYDSAGDRTRNFSQAKRLARVLAQGSKSPVGVGTPVVQARPCSRQANTFDCGVYVLLFSAIIADTFVSRRGACGTSTAMQWEQLLTQVSPAQANNLREQYRDVMLSRA